MKLTPETNNLLIETLRNLQAQIDRLSQDIHGDAGLKERLIELEETANRIAALLEEQAKVKKAFMERWGGLLFKIASAFALIALGYLATKLGVPLPVPGALQ